MTSTTRKEKETAKLGVLEREFRELLISALKKCTDGGRGIFLRDLEAERFGYERFVWPEVRRLDELGSGILKLRARLGEPESEALYTRYLRYCEITGANAPGGSKLARKFLIELGQEPEASR